jgi:tRNA uridine 5-carbamoylmethylation protein Kti12
MSESEEEVKYVTIELEASLYALLKENAENKHQSIAEHLYDLIWREYHEENTHFDWDGREDDKDDD